MDPPAILILVCAKTGSEISAHARYTRADLKRLQAAKLKLHCSACGKVHLFFFSDARLKPISGET